MSGDGEHPSALVLDAFAVGHGDDATRVHVDGCARCAAYTEALRRGSEALAGDAARVEAFVGAVRARAREGGGARTRWPSPRALAAVASGLALAAGVLLFVHRGGGGASGASRAGVMGTVEPSVRFKGGAQIATIVERGGVQTRHTGAMALQPNDRIRLEIALDHEERVEAGVLGDDGDWGELQPPAVLSPGTHYSASSVEFDRDVPSGWILAGPADAVERARATRDFHDVVSVRIGASPKEP